MQALAEKLVLERLLNSWVLTYISPKSSVEPSRLYSFCEEEDGYFQYICTIAPKPHPDIDTYLIRFAKGVGVCNIRGVITDVYTDESGSGLRAKTDRIANQVSLKYGPWSRKIDEVEGYDSPSQWMHLLRKGLRIYGYNWDSSDLSAGHRSSITTSISIFSAAPDTLLLGRNLGWVFIDFDTPLEDACDKAQSDVF
ncbi:MAG: hypothetical protein F4Z73_01175 [Synechococcus sp. SB0668_bin_13]|nr:hypothetical protein [Synechococcus sp. SB0668_bin_13]